MNDSNKEKKKIEMNDYSTVGIIAGAAINSAAVISSAVSSVLGNPAVKAMEPDIISSTTDTIHKKDLRRDTEEESMSKDFSSAFEDEE